jgi:hypothetical protein
MRAGLVVVSLPLLLLGLSAGCPNGGTARRIVDGGDVPPDAVVDRDADQVPDASAFDAGEHADAVAPDASPPDTSPPDANPPDAGCPPGPTTSGFRPVACGALAQPRSGHAGVLLLDWRVLLLAGWYGASLIDDVEAFDPTTETFAVVASLAHPRIGHRATRLADGRVLVTGGHLGDGTITATTEIFDPATDTIAAGPAMLLPRTSHTATLLADGRVLVTGGVTVSDPDPDSEGVKVAEVFDPVAGTFALVGAMAEERHAHEAVRLLDGRVLLTGGADAPSCCDDGIDDAELFDPATNTFAATGSLVTARPAHRTTLLPDGRVLVTGGSIAHGGASGPTYITDAELYDPVSGTFASTGSMTTAPGWYFTATLLTSGRVLVAGDLLGDRAELYDPGTGTFTVVADRMDAPRAAHSATRLAGGAVLVCGGRGLATAELYFP